MKNKPLIDNVHLYFLSSVISGHLNLFIKDEYAMIILKSLDYLRRKKFIKLFAFVIMPSHIHILFKVLKNYTINQIVKKFHSFTSHIILKQLGKNKDRKIQIYFKNCTFSKKKDRCHYIWQDSVVKNIFSQAALNKIIEYIHSNPCNKNWFLVNDRAEYKFSSACFYDRGEKPIIEIDDIRKLFK